MKSDNLPLAAKVLPFVPAPAFGLGSMPEKSEREFVMFAHLFALIVWPWKRSASPAVDAHGKEALNFAITLLLVMFPLGIISGFLGSTIALLVSLLSSLVSFAAFALVICAAFQAREGRLLRYPFNLRLIK